MRGNYNDNQRAIASAADLLVKDVGVMPNIRTAVHVSHIGLTVNAEYRGKNNNIPVE